MPHAMPPKRQSKEDLLKNEYSDAYEATWRDGNLEKRLEICLEAVRNYPGDMEWMSRLAMAHSMHCHSYEDNERYRAEREEAIRCYKIVIENTTNEKMKEPIVSAGCRFTAAQAIPTEQK